VGRFEPQVALYGGEDGLAVIRALVAQAETRLKPDGWLIFEFGFGQHEAVRRLLEGEAWTDVAVRNDLQGIPRTAIARRRGGMGGE